MAQKLGKKKRSAAYPLLSLPEAIEAAIMVVDNLGPGPHSREALARGMGYASFSGAASGKVGALAHFGLVSRIAGRYLFTELAKNIFSSPETSVLEISQAASRPALYRALIVRFLGEALPKDMATLLASDYKITAKAAPAAAQNFIKTLEFSSLIKNGRVVDPSTTQESNFAEGSAGPAPVRLPQAMAAAAGNGSPAETKIKIELSSGIEVAFPSRLAYRISMGEFALDLKNLDEKAAGGARV